MMTIRFYILGLILSIFLFSCASEASESTAENSKIEKELSDKSITDPSTEEDVTETVSITESKAFYWVGLAMNAATKMVIPSLDMDNGPLNFNEINAVNEVVQKNLQDLLKYKLKHKDVFLADTKNREFLSAFESFASSCKELSDKVKNNESTVIQASYVEKMNKGYNVLGKVYTKFIQ